MRMHSARACLAVLAMAAITPALSLAAESKFGNVQRFDPALDAIVPADYRHAAKIVQVTKFEPSDLDKISKAHGGNR